MADRQACEKTYLLFWPRIVGTAEEAANLSVELGETHKTSVEMSRTPPGTDEGSEPESEAQYYRLPISLQSGQSSSSMTEQLLKVILIGDPTVGKTSFVHRYVQNKYRQDYKGTIGVDFAMKIIKWSETETIKLQLWDIAGQERFTWMTRVYYKDAHGCVIMFDLTNKNSFVNTLKWKRDVDTKCSLPDGSPIPCMLLANKCDLAHRQIDQMEIETFYKEHNFIGWTETSAKEGLMVNDSMKFLADVMMRQGGMIAFTSQSFKLSGPAPKARSKCFC